LRFHIKKKKKKKKERKKKKLTRKIENRMSDLIWS